jgi:hypothetical protein
MRKLFRCHLFLYFIISLMLSQCVGIFKLLEYLGNISTVNYSITTVKGRTSYMNLRKKGILSSSNPLTS